MKKVLKIALLGASGRIGQGLTKNIEQNPDLLLSHNITRERLENKTLHLDDVDVIIDFSLPRATIELIRLMKENNIDKPLMIGTTGFSDNQWDEIRSFARTSSVIQTSNTSLSIALMCQFAEKAASIFGDEYEILITEVHHKHKVDSPSGTAKMLEQACMRGNSKRPYLQASRIGEVKGMHEVTFFGPHDRIVIRHEADDRQLFCEGALILAKWIVNQKPDHLYSIQDFLRNQ